MHRVCDEGNCIVLQYINVSNEHTVHFKCIQHYMSNIFNLKKHNFSERMKATLNKC